MMKIQAPLHSAQAEFPFIDMNLQRSLLKIVCCALCVLVAVQVYSELSTPVVQGGFVRIATFKNIYAADSIKGSTCSTRATKRGPSQKVVSFSYFHNPHGNRDYFAGIERNVNMMPKFYPGWVMRVYHDLMEQSLLQKIDNLTRRYGSILDFCYVGDLPGYGNLLGRQQSTWRFLTLVDPLVDVTVFRDLDSNFQERELAAVHEWLDTKYPMHSMRDHPAHSPVIMAGMWGAQLHTGKREVWRQLTNDLMELVQSKHAQTNPEQLDQPPLAVTVWPHALREKGFVMQHDSYRCMHEKYLAAGGLRPFPTCRGAKDQEEPNFVGARYKFDDNINATCPERCRAKPNCPMLC